jgi:hypothetical protein
MIHAMMLRSLLLLALLAGAATGAYATETRFDARSERMPAGDGSFEVTGVPRGPVTIYSFRPDSADSNSPIWIVMPGARRNAARTLAFDYYDTWRPLAEQYGAILLVPDFTAEKWPGAWTYNLGNVRGRHLEPIPWRQTSFYVVEAAFRLAARSLGSHRHKFSIFGHGAGSQFVQRYVLHSGCRMVDRAVAANPGWYMMPDYQDRFPFGLRNAPIPQQTLRAGLGCRFTLLLGTADLNRQGLRNDPEAVKQGPTRYARGHYYFRRSREVAARLGARFNWRLVEVEGAGHVEREMSPAGAAVLAGRAAPGT